jgi:hypothetical protein
LNRISRAEDLTITWTGSDPARELVTVVAFSSGDPYYGVGAALLCTEFARAGQLTIPAWVLSALPRSGQNPALPGLANGVLGLVNSRPETEGAFRASGIDVGRFGYLTVQMKNVEFK